MGPSGRKSPGLDAATALGPGKGGGTVPKANRPLDTRNIDAETHAEEHQEAAASPLDPAEALMDALRAQAEEMAEERKRQAAAKAARVKAVERIRVVREQAREQAAMKKLESPSRPRKNQTEFLREEAERKKELRLERERAESEGDRRARLAEEQRRTAEREQHRQQMFEQEVARQKAESARLLQEHMNNERRTAAASQLHRRRISDGAKRSDEGRQGLLESSRDVSRLNVVASL